MCRKSARIVQEKGCGCGLDFFLKRTRICTEMKMESDCGKQGETGMKAGDSWECPYCGKSSFLKKESVMDGWKKTGEVLRCAACSAFVENVVESSASGKSCPDGAGDSKKAFLAFLGEDEEEKQAAFSTMEREECRFCRDCKYRVMTAFQIFCTKHEKEVGPMEDCPDFIRRPDSES